MYEIKLNLFKIYNVNAWRCQIRRYGWIILVLLVAVVAKLEEAFPYM